MKRENLEKDIEKVDNIIDTLMHLYWQGVIPLDYVNEQYDSLSKKRKELADELYEFRLWSKV